jgi:hypothetical protein
MKLNLIAAAALTLGIASSSFAATYDFTTDAYANSTANGDAAGATSFEGALNLTAGEAFTVSTDANQFWHGAFEWDGNYAMLTSNADGAATMAYAPYINGIGYVAVGTLVADINGDYRIIGAGTRSFTAWGTGQLEFHYADINTGDNSGSVSSTVTVVPEPGTIGMLLAGLAAIGAVSRRRKI